ncbi:hypothetical protein ABZ876_38050 [Streptomyces sp. NPDC046931]|uniref:hypothetical protein n=1 Tax=Streptomyces sp. NPDC046931 TaxID=3154806 RepID=UPI0033E71169
MALVGGLDAEVIVSTDMAEDLYSVEFYRLPGGCEFLCAVTAGALLAERGTCLVRSCELAIHTHEVTSSDAECRYL